MVSILLEDFDYLTKLKKFLKKKIDNDVEALFVGSTVINQVGEDIDIVIGMREGTNDEFISAVYKTLLEAEDGKLTKCCDYGLNKGAPSFAAFRTLDGKYNFIVDARPTKLWELATKISLEIVSNIKRPLTKNERVFIHELILGGDPIDKLFTISYV